MLPRTLQEFFDELELQPEDPGRLILPTDRSAAAFRGAYNARQQQRGRSAWEPAPALSWKQWTMSLWSELIVQGNEERLLLNTSQEHALWCEVIREHAGSVPTLGSVDALADLAAEAFQLVASHNALHRLRSSAQSHDSRIFAEWAEAFRRSCIANNCISASLLEQAVTQHIERDKLAAPSTFTLVGFLEQSPAQELLLAACEQKGTTIRRSRFAPAAGIPLTRRSMILPTEREELRHAALWAGEHLRNHHGAEPPRLAIILPSGEEDRAMLEQALRSILTPELESIHADLSSTPWAFSSGPALATEPIVLAALTIARWAGHPLPIDLISALLLSPYIAANADAKQRAASARFDATVLRRTPRLRDEMTVEQVLALGADRRDNAAARTTAPAVLERLRDVQHVIERAGALDRQRSFAEWTSSCVTC
jgi:ATP-dependent helicase/nuclease subunit B